MTPQQLAALFRSIAFLANSAAASAEACDNSSAWDDLDGIREDVDKLVQNLPNPDLD